MLSAQDWDAVLVTLKLASISCCVLLVVGTPLAWCLSRMQNRGKFFVEALVALPLILPPTVLGFYLLLAFSPQSGLGQLWQAVFSSNLAFSFSGLIIGSVIYSLPFVVQPLQAAFEQLPEPLLESAATMGASFSDRFLHLVLPLCKRSFILASGLGFAHTVGEFGVVLMIGGNIPGETQVLSIALYDHVESLNFASAHILAAGLLVFSFMTLALLYSNNKPQAWRAKT